MARIEPTFSRNEFEANSAADAHVRALAKSRRIHKAVKDWRFTLLLLAGTVAICYASAVYSGILPEQFKLGAPLLLQRVLIILGFVVVLGSQFVGSIALFRFGFERGALALLLPGYLLIGLKRSGIFWQVMGPWCVGVLMVVLGTILLN